MHVVRLWPLALTLLSAPLLAGEPVNVNTADAETIARSLDGVGMAKAQAIVEYRETNGPFKHRDELVNVKGIGLRTVDLNQEYILVVETSGEAKVANR